MIGRALAFFAGLLVQRLLTIREDFEDRLEALEDEADARVQFSTAYAPPGGCFCNRLDCEHKPRDADGRERSVSN